MNSINKCKMWNTFMITKFAIVSTFHGHTYFSTVKDHKCMVVYWNLSCGVL